MSCFVPKLSVYFPEFRYISCHLVLSLNTFRSSKSLNIHNLQSLFILIVFVSCVYVSVCVFVFFAMKAMLERHYLFKLFLIFRCQTEKTNIKE